MYQDDEKKDRRRKNVMGSYNYYKMFGCFNRKFKINDLSPPADVVDVFKLCCGGELEMSPYKFLRFLIEFQEEEEWVKIEDVERAMDRVLNSSKTHLTRYVFSVNDFFQYLLLDDLNGPLKTQVHHDMTAPLQHYFIYTGHNSYLTGNQLSSDCSEVPIIKALQRGVRAIELDLWPSSSKDRIHVLHGRTLTTPVTLKKCLKSIKEHAFVNSPYPVIITLEDHLTPNLQAKVAEMVTSIFGDMLYFPKASDKEEFPSPDALKHHIILSTKPPKEYLQSKNKERSSLDKDSSDEELEDQQSQSDQDEDNERYSASEMNIASSSTSQPLSEILGVDYENAKIKDENFGHQAAPENQQLHASKPKSGTTKMLRNETGIPNRLSVSETTLDSESFSTSQPLSEILGVDHENADTKDEHFGHQVSPENHQLHASKPKSGTRKMSRNETGIPKRLSVSEPALDSESSSLSQPLTEILQASKPKNGTRKMLRNETGIPKRFSVSESTLDSETSSTSQPLSEILVVDYENNDIKDEKLGLQETPENKHLQASKPKNGTRKMLRNETGIPKRFSVSESTLDSETSSTSQPLSEILGVDYENNDIKDEKLGLQETPEKKHLQASKPKNGTRKMLRNETGIPKRFSVSESTLESESSSTSQPLSEILGVDYEDDDIEDEKFGHQAAPEYKHLIAIHASKPKNGTRKALRDEPGKAKRLSVSEQALEKAANLYGTDIVRFTQKYILRVFPKGTRVTSTNFRPLTAWMHGAQMVAFNMQGYGRSLWMMHGMFKSNGGCGYVRKPDFLMDQGPDGEVFNPKAKSLPVKKTLKVKIYMGDGWRLDFSQTHFDAFSPPDFYTKIYMAGVPADVAKKRTKVIGDDWTPIWNEEFTFPLRVPELALLEIVVQEYDVDRDDFAGQACLPVSELRPGIRVVPLYNKKGEKFKHVKLLMRFLFV